MSKILIATLIALSLAACVAEAPSAAPYTSGCANGEACHGHMMPTASAGGS